MPGSFGPVEVRGADERALRLIANLGFRPPRRAAAPVHLQTQEGPLIWRALATRAAERLAAAGYRVDLDAELRVSDLDERTMEALDSMSRSIDQLLGLLEEMDSVHDLSDAAAQLVSGPHGPIYAMADVLQRAGDHVRRTAGEGPDGGLADFFHTGSRSMADLAASADAVSYLPRPAATADRRQAATVRSTSIGTGASPPPVRAEAAPAAERANGSSSLQAASTEPDPATAVRRLTARLDETADPAEAARLVEQAEQHLEALSDFFGAAARWSGAREGTAHLQLDLGRTSQDVYDAGADLADVVVGLRDAAPRPAGIRSTAAPTAATASAAAPAAPAQARPGLRR
ncbi:hypothetical protein HUT16_17510 [Kitasatospora sp. NA04385]|uniref:hypothetical protein n=1 Tax=Kitasatospora sp. NA04385 TaxID=2742135 RepID=UPI00159136E1|nr:hypothetical protein [Kitasatospora sp. NA04385]QKW20628.1 hypothetical protein HUT16_17510 [Kitasatospora sp. NA04385]